jgi:hypothetical protein
LSGESLPSVETIKRLFLFREKERYGKARRGQGQGKPRQSKASQAKDSFSIERGERLSFSIERRKCLPSR